MNDNGHHGHDETLAEQRLHLASLESCEEKIRKLRDQECDLEVENMAAQAALHSAEGRAHANIDPTLALRIGRLLGQRRELETNLHDAGEPGRARGSASARRVDQLRAGHAALQAWFDASKREAPGGMSLAAKAALVIATVATVWAAIALHPAFLLLLIAVVGPISFALGRGQDAEWRRVGARRRYETSGLAEIASWDKDGVRARLRELESLLEADAGDAPQVEDEAPDGEPGDGEDSGERIAGIDAHIASELAAAGLTNEDMEGATREWLRLLARADRSRESLERVRDERKRLRAEAAELRDRLVRYLHSRGARPTEQPDTAADIAERLDRLSASR